MTAQAVQAPFFGWRVVGGAFVLAVFGWGLGFYGPPVFLHAVREARGWPLTLVSVAVTTHFLVGAVVVANLPALYRRFGVPSVTKAGALALGLGVFGWAVAAEPWQLMAATVLSGGGWVAMGAAAVNAIVSPWFVRSRPAALSMAYNGASIGGVLFSPLWVMAISSLGFPTAAALIGLVTVVVMWVLADVVFRHTPESLGVEPDGDTAGARPASAVAAQARPLPGSALWRDLGFITLAAGMALGLFAQIGLIAHLFSLLVPALGAQYAGLAMGFATICAIAGRTLVGWLMPADADRRLVGCLAYAVQIVGSVVFILAAGENVALLLLGVALFGSGIGNATSLPPLIAQVEFTREDVPRVVALIVAIAQASYAFAPAAFGLIRDLTQTTPGAAPLFFAAAAVVQGLAIATFLIGRRRQPM
ncbi:MFS transporter [Phreatobacter stygius]|uniref:MFS transporter n=1 Tax=Phreatobacter stygius TaxID=1940610 RepID=A0A4D7B5U6_9HYPH|nr:MFS transporter [Phreatobacter stygius]QCI65480.1 MFS transporter [Phreatobacter stygius]